MALSILDALYCEEEQWEVEEEEEEEEIEDVENINNNNISLFPIMQLEQDMFWEDEELISLFCKEKKQGILGFDECCYRREAVEWMLMVNTHFGFCTLTAILAVNYLDRFISSFHFQKDKPWTMQLVAVTCISLAAKVEESDVPLLLDLQVEGTKYMFKAKDIQKMELLMLSTFQWKMHPVTPLSFLDHIIRRLGLKNHLHWEFLRRCEGLLMSLLPDWRFVRYPPSVLATATMMHVIDQIEACNSLEYQNQLLGVLNISKENVNDCYKLMVEISSSNTGSSSKRKFEELLMNGSDINNIPSSPSGVIDAYLSSDSSNDSWATTPTATTTITTNDNNKNVIGLSLSSSSTSSSPVMSRKRGRVAMPMQLHSLPRVFVDVVGSPR